MDQQKTSSHYGILRAARLFPVKANVANGARHLWSRGRIALFMIVIVERTK
jgi:hypothetical protein